MARARSAPLAVALLAFACGTSGTPEGGADNLPTSGVGPFRKLSASEVSGVAPFVLEATSARYREPAALALDADPASARVALYAVAATSAGTHDVVVRTRADDARTFFGDGSGVGVSDGPAVVLQADAPWEGANLAGPSALRVGGSIYLYYAAGGGIGVATSSDGLAFTKQPAPVLTSQGAAAWETTPPSAPSVAVFPDGTWHMLYASGTSIGEATSPDGLTWTRASSDPVLSPAAPVDPSTLAPGEKPPFDTARVTDPCLAPRTTPAGRLQVRVLYTGLDATGASTIGFAARFGDAGPLDRNPSPVYSVGKHEAAPALFEWAGDSMLYVQQDYGSGTASSPLYPAIAAAFAPAQDTLPAPGDAPSGP